jgi:hypothetical protein
VSQATEFGTFAFEQTVETVSPNASLEAQDFWVQKTGAALTEPGDIIVVSFQVGAVSTRVCVIAPPFLGHGDGLSCTGPAAPISIPAGSTIAINVTTVSGEPLPGYDLLFGWQATN